MVFAGFIAVFLVVASFFGGAIWVMSKYMGDGAPRARSEERERVVSVVSMTADRSERDEGPKER
jgi:hypothetical protein